MADRDPRPRHAAPPTVDEDLRFQAREWRFQRAGWVLLAVLVAAAAAGLLGPGWASRSVADEPASRLRIEHERFARRLSPVQLYVRLPPETAPGEQRIWVGAGLLEALRLEGVVPAPARVEPGAEGSSFVFAAAGGAAEVRFELEYERSGLVRGRVGRSPTESVELAAFVYP